MTRRWHIEDAPTTLQLQQITQELADGHVVLLPTDTIYGLHALATSDAAVERIAEIKGRDESTPFIVLASSVQQLREIGVAATPDLLEALGSIWPAPLTAILPLARPLPASRGAQTLAVRIPAVDWLRELAQRTGPLVSTSANRSGEPPVEAPEMLAYDLQQRVDAIVDGGVRKGKPSAILDLTGAEPRFIRGGDYLFTQKVWKTLRKSL